VFKGLNTSQFIFLGRQ